MKEEINCTTYEGQPRRDMKKDDIYDWGQFQKIDKMGIDARKILDFLKVLNFHSVENCIYVLKAYIALSDRSGMKAAMDAAVQTVA